MVGTEINSIDGAAPTLPALKPTLSRNPARFVAQHRPHVAVRAPPLI